LPKRASDLVGILASGHQVRIGYFGARRPVAHYQAALRLNVNMAKCCFTANLAPHFRPKTFRFF